MDIPASKCEIVRQIEYRVLHLFHVRLCYGDQGTNTEEGCSFIRIRFMQNKNSIGLEETSSSTLLNKAKVIHFVVILYT